VIDLDLGRARLRDHAWTAAARISIAVLRWLDRRGKR
jgi:hypothetical protein